MLEFDFTAYVKDASGEKTLVKKTVPGHNRLDAETRFNKWVRKNKKSTYCVLDCRAFKLRVTKTRVELSDADLWTHEHSRESMIGLTK